MKRLSTALTLMTALAAIAAASTQPEEHAPLAAAAVTVSQHLGDALEQTIGTDATAGLR